MDGHVRSGKLPGVYCNDEVIMDVGKRISAALRGVHPKEWLDDEAVVSWPAGIATVYGLDGLPVIDFGKPIAPTSEEYQRYREASLSAPRHKAPLWFEGVALEVSTVWLGHNYRYREGPPLIFETKVFANLDAADQWVWLYSTSRAALHGHLEVVTALCDAGATIAGEKVEGES
jgi:hypothetical protein